MRQLTKCIGCILLTVCCLCLLLGLRPVQAADRSSLPAGRKVFEGIEKDYEEYLIKRVGETGKSALKIPESASQKERKLQTLQPDDKKDLRKARLVDLKANIDLKLKIIGTGGETPIYLLLNFSEPEVVISKEQVDSVGRTKSLGSLTVEFPQKGVYRSYLALMKTTGLVVMLPPVVEKNTQAVFLCPRIARKAPGRRVFAESGWIITDAAVVVSAAAYGTMTSTSDEIQVRAEVLTSENLVVAHPFIDEDEGTLLSAKVVYDHGWDREYHSLTPAAGAGTQPVGLSAVLAGVSPSVEFEDSRQQGVKETFQLTMEVKKVRLTRGINSRLAKAHALIASGTCYLVVRRESRTEEMISAPSGAPDGRP